MTDSVEVSDDLRVELTDPESYIVDLVNYICCFVSLNKTRGTALRVVLSHLNKVCPPALVAVRRLAPACLTTKGLLFPVVEARAFKGVNHVGWKKRYFIYGINEPYSIS